ncbi:MAG: cytochrome c maturation protein CcmE [Chloroflexi bacterium]|nr:cytochrome c maturation protein CcmE [Chloroflexota bacterium]
MKKRKKWLLAVWIVVGIGIIYGGYSLFAHTGTDYITVGQFISQADSLRDQQVSIGGKVAPGSVKWDSQARITSFALTDGQARLPVRYAGMPPDTFKPGDNLVVKGKYRSDNVLEAYTFDRGRSVCNLCH